jgi:O-antigen ligase
LAGAWRGLTNHKNTFGAIAGTALVLWLHGWVTGEMRSWRALLGCSLAAACLTLSRSSTAAISALAAVVLLLLLLWSPRNVQAYLKYSVVFAAVVLMVYALAILRLIPGSDLLLAPVTLVTGMDATFTGRSEIWAIIVERIHLNPLLGVGYLDVANDLGWSGLVCLLGYLVVHLRQSLRVLITDQRQGALFLALFLQQAMVNLSESHWFSVLSLQFLLMTLATAALARLLLEANLRARFGEPFRQVQPMAAPSDVAPATLAPPADAVRA